MKGIKLVFLFILPLISASQELSFALEQINASAIIQSDLTGKGVKVGIIDGGFLNANERPSLSGHFKENRISFYKDYITPNLKDYGGSRGQDDGHGTQVWENIGGMNPETKVQYGLATDSEYFLARTDHAVFERRIEEKYLIQAVQDMVKLGVRIINISLGYTNGYSRKNENYTPEMIDGKSTWITSSVDSLLAVHEVLLIVSAGNDGHTKWRTLSAPADSENVLTVGASKLNLPEKMRYSSIGSEQLEYVKPDVSCFATAGTSFSAPVITGLVACMVQKQPDISNYEIIQIIKGSSSLYPFPNNHTGYGVPDASKILSTMDSYQNHSMQIIESEKNRVFIESNDTSRVVIYHKKDQWKVIRKENIKVKRRFKVKRISGATSTTVISDKLTPVEIIWKD